MSEKYIDARKLKLRTDEQRYIRYNRKIVREGKDVPKKVFEAGNSANIEPRVDMEIVPIYLDPHDNIMIYIAHRSSDDPFWPGGRGLIGTAIRKKDVGNDRKLTKSWKRIMDKELKRDDIPAPILVDVRLDNTSRETEVAIIFLVEVDDKLKGGEYVNAQNLPDDLIKHHYEYISLAVKKFKEIKNI